MRLINVGLSQLIELKRDVRNIPIVFDETKTDNIDTQPIDLIGDVKKTRAGMLV